MFHMWPIQYSAWLPPVVNCYKGEKHCLQQSTAYFVRLGFPQVEETRQYALETIAYFKTSA